jgi:hypothetical protein
MCKYVALASRHACTPAFSRAYRGHIPHAFTFQVAGSTGCVHRRLRAICPHPVPDWQCSSMTHDPAVSTSILARHGHQLDMSAICLLFLPHSTSRMPLPAAEQDTDSCRQANAQNSHMLLRRMACSNCAKPQLSSFSSAPTSVQPMTPCNARCAIAAPHAQRGSCPAGDPFAPGWGV